MYYIRIDNDKFGFVVNDIHEILDTDIKISDEDYNKFFKLQSQGKQFRIKNQQSTTLFEILEEYVPEHVDIHSIPSTEERLVALENIMLEIINS